LSEFVGRCLEVKLEADGRILVRSEPGLPFAVRSATGNVATRFEPLMPGDVLTIGAVCIAIATGTDDPPRAAVQELDASSLRGLVKAPGATHEWYDRFMEVADHLEGLKDPDEMVRVTMAAILSTTSADRVFVELEPGWEVAGQREWFQSRAAAGAGTPGSDGTTGVREARFQVSRSLVEHVKQSKGIVHVPVAQSDPSVSALQSVRSEGISSTFAMPLRALGKTVGILYADCTAPGRVLAAADFQHAAMIRAPVRDIPRQPRPGHELRAPRRPGGAAGNRRHCAARARPAATWSSGSGSTRPPTTSS
jgi:hypothetical protein